MATLPTNVLLKQIHTNPSEKSIYYDNKKLEQNIPLPNLEPKGINCAEFYEMQQKQPTLELIPNLKMDSIIKNRWESEKADSEPKKKSSQSCCTIM